MFERGSEYGYPYSHIHTKNYNSRFFFASLLCAVEAADADADGDGGWGVGDWCLCLHSHFYLNLFSVVLMNRAPLRFMAVIFFDCDIEEELLPNSYSYKFGVHVQTIFILIYYVLCAMCILSLYSPNGGKEIIAQMIPTSRTRPFQNSHKSYMSHQRLHHDDEKKKMKKMNSAITAICFHNGCMIC